VLIYKGVEKQLSGFCENTTNNRMEMLAIIKALEQLKEPCKIDIYSDSAYVVNAFLQNWIEDWIKKGWKTSNKKEVKNIDLWQKIIEFTNIHQIVWHKVKGHSDNEYNNLCDKLATTEVENWINSHPEFKVE
ncbi:MAG: ribonuclease HI, partial [Clostridia bacterium]|nr:ribonuclease HI [Clostridia bacterium]